MHYIVHYMVHYMVHYIVHYIVHCIVHYIVHYIVVHYIGGLDAHVAHLPSLLDVVALKHLLDVLRDGGVGPDLLLVHQADELRLGERTGGRGAALAHQKGRGREVLALVKLGHLAAAPLLVRVHAQVLHVDDHQPRGGELLPRHLDLPGQSEQGAQVRQCEQGVQV